MKIRVDYAYRERPWEAFKDQEPKIVSDEEFERMCEDSNCFILRVGLIVKDD